MDKDSMKHPKLSEEQEKLVKIWRKNGKFTNPVDCDSRPIKTSSVEEECRKKGIKVGKILSQCRLHKR